MNEEFINKLEEGYIIVNNTGMGVRDVDRLVALGYKVLSVRPKEITHRSAAITVKTEIALVKA